MKLLITAIILGGILAAPVLAETGTTNIIDGVNTNAGATFIIGDTGPYNALIITNAGSVSNGVAVIGNQIGASNNTVLVTGGSVWTNVGALTIGNTGAVNQLTISAGGIVIDTTGTIGMRPSSSNNTVTVTGIGSLWSNTSTLVVGNAGVATSHLVTTPGSFNKLLVTNGGTVFSASGIIGYNSPNNAEAAGNNVTVTGSGSVWTNTGSLTVGHIGGGNSLVIANSGKVYNTTALIAYSRMSNSVLVTGQGSLWQSSGRLSMGGDANSRAASLTISNGGAASANGITTSVLTDNNILVTDSNSVLTSSGSVSIGGTRNQLVVSNSATANLNSTLATAGVSNKVIVTGNGSVLNNPGGFYIDGTFAKLIITNGGLITVGTGVDASVGNANGTAFNEMIVTGAGSTFSNNAGNFRVGNLGKTNTFTVSAGGLAVMPNANGLIGWQGNPSFGVAHGNKALVTGSGSTWQLGFGLNVGDGQSSGNNGGVTNNSLVIANGGQVVIGSGNVIVGYHSLSANNFILITNGGLLQANSLTAGVGGGNSISNVGGVYQFTTATPAITNNGFGRVALTDGTISFRGINNAEVFANVNGVGNKLTNMAFAGKNTFQLNSATNTTVASYTFNSGLGATNYQRLALTNGSRWQSTTLTIGSGGALIGNGTVASANVTNLGTIAPGFSAGTLTFTSNLVLGGSSVLQMEIGGTSPSAYDQLIVFGNVTLTGALAVASINGFNTTPGQTFTLIDNQGANPVFGEFTGLTNNAFIDASANGGSAYFFIQYNIGSGLNDVVLTATIPEPSTLAMVVVAACALLCRKSKRE